MELGALICTPRQPSCTECPVRSQCAAFQRGRTAVLPNLGPRPRATSHRYAAFLVRDGDRFLVRQRPAGAVNAHLWEFPTLEMAGPRETATQAAQRLFGFAPEVVTPLGRLKHTITHHRITLEAFTAEGLPAAARMDGAWLTAAQMARLPFTAAHKRIRCRYAPPG